MEPLAGWEKILVGALAAVLVVWLWPGLRAAVQRSREARERDWGAALLPLAAVVLFVLLLVALV